MDDRTANILVVAFVFVIFVVTIGYSFMKWSTCASDEVLVRGFGGYVCVKGH